MKKRLLPLFAIMVVSSVSIAKPIDRTVALQIATVQYNHTQPTKALPSTSRLQLTWTGSPIVQANDGAPFYLFSEENGGFVLIAGDDRAFPILAYNNKGSFDPLAMPAHIASWINHYRQQIEWLKQNPQYDNPQAAKLWSQYLSGGSKSTVLKQITTPLWDQSEPYNRYTPTVSNSGTPTHTLTGCVATGIGIYMRTTSDRTTPISNGTNISYSQTNPTATISRTLPSSYNFDLMPYIVTSSTTELEKNAIAHFLADCGAIAQMHYDLSASSTTIPNAAIGLCSYFGYDKSLAYYFRDYYPGEWSQLLKTELDNNRPVMYAGQDNTYGGHFFIVDGYTNDSPTLFSINFGWSGYANGYYSLDAITPSGTPYSFSTTEQAIIGATPSSAGSKYKLNAAIIPYTYNGNASYGLQSTATIIRNISFNLQPLFITNTTVKEPINGQLQIWHVDNNNQMIEVLKTVSVTLNGSYIYLYNLTGLKITQKINAGDKIQAYLTCSTTDVESGPVRLYAPIGTYSEIQLLPTDIDTPESSPITIYGRDLTIVVQGETAIGHEAYIYTMKGEMILKQTITQTETRFSMPAGIYIVRIGKQSSKIAL